MLSTRHRTREGANIKEPQQTFCKCQYEHLGQMDELAEIQKLIVVV